MKKIYQREIRHIIANHSLRNKSTAYSLKSRSIAYSVIRKLIKHNWIEGENIVGPFLFVRPTEKLITIFGALEIKVTTPAIQSPKLLLNRNALTENSQFKLAEIRSNR